MWTVAVVREARTDRETVWAWYEATDLAPQWDPLVRRIESTGPIVLGGTGRNHPRRGPVVSFRYTEVSRLNSYTETTSAPGASMAFTHVLTDAGEGRLLLTHGAVVSGPLAWLYRPLLSGSFRRGMRQALDELVRRVEAGPPGVRAATDAS